MDKKFKVLSQVEQRDSSNYWNSCPLNNKTLPKDPCPEGLPNQNTTSKVQEEPGCPWWVNSKKHNYCFWKLVKDNSNSKGDMPEMVQSDLAKLFGWSNTKAHFMLKEATENLVEILKLSDMDLELDVMSDDLTIDDLINSLSNEKGTNF